MADLESFTLYQDRPINVEMTDNLNLKLTDGDRFIYINLSDEEIKGFALKMNGYDNFRRRKNHA